MYIYGINPTLRNNFIHYYVMRIICDAPGQTCNRLWTYVASVAECIAEKKKMTILFFDWTIEDFPNLLHCPFIYFPLYHKWYLERGNGWNNYKGLVWKVTHNKTWDNIFKFFGCIKGWDTMTDIRYLQQTKKELQHIFRPRKEITDKAEAFIGNIREKTDIVIGVHIRHGDYKSFYNGRFYYTLEDYHQFMLKILELYKNKKVAFFISSNANFTISQFTGCNCYRFEKEPSGDILDLYTLSLCDRIIGPWSTYNRWASFIGEVPLYCFKHKEEVINENSFSVISDFYHFSNGESTIDLWKKNLL